jgi:hypothetical protein
MSPIVDCKYCEYGQHHGECSIFENDNDYYKIINKIGNTNLFPNSWYKEVIKDLEK